MRVTTRQGIRTKRSEKKAKSAGNDPSKLLLVVITHESKNEGAGFPQTPHHHDPAVFLQSGR